MQAETAKARMAVSGRSALVAVVVALVTCGATQWSAAASAGASRRWLVLGFLLPHACYLRVLTSLTAPYACAVDTMRALAKEKPLEFATAVGTMMLAVVLVVHMVVGQQRDAALRQQQQQNFEKLSRDIAALSERSLAGNELILRFSTVGSSALTSLLSKLGLSLHNGDESELHVRRRGRGGVAAAAAFSWEQHASENAGLPSILQHIETELTRLGVSFGTRGGFDLLDVHTMQTMLSFTVAGVRYSGGADAAIVPHNVALESAAQQARVVFEIKRRKEVRPDLSEHFGQSVTELIGASVRSVYPCLHVLTDGINCSLARLGDGCVMRWRSVPFATALPYVAAFLSEPNCADPHFGVSDMARDAPDVARIVENLRQLTAEPDLLATIAEQLDSLADANAANGGAARMRLATELVATWQHQLAALPLEALPKHISLLYL